MTEIEAERRAEDDAGAHPLFRDAPRTRRVQQAAQAADPA